MHVYLNSANSTLTCVSTLALSIRVLASAIKPLIAQPLRRRDGRSKHIFKPWILISETRPIEGLFYTVVLIVKSFLIQKYVDPIEIILTASTSYLSFSQNDREHLFSPCVTQTTWAPISVHFCVLFDSVCPCLVPSLAAYRCGCRSPQSSRCCLAPLEEMLSSSPQPDTPPQMSGCQWLWSPAERQQVFRLLLIETSYTKMTSCPQSHPLSFILQCCIVM